MTNVTSPKEDDRIKPAVPTKTKSPMPKIDDEMEKAWKEMEDISIMKAKPQMKTTDSMGKLKLLPSSRKTSVN